MSLFNVSAAFKALGVAKPEPEAPNAAKRAETDAKLAALVAADVLIVRAWAIMCAGLRALGVNVADLPASIMFDPTLHDLNAIAHNWQSAESVYIAHNRANRALKAVIAVLGDTLAVGSAKNGADIIRTTPTTKANGQGGYRMSEKARETAVAWANANASADVKAFVNALTPIVKKGDEEAANAFIAAYSANAANEANKDALSAEQLARFAEDRAKLPSKRRPMAEIIGAAPQAPPETPPEA